MASNRQKLYKPNHKELNSELEKEYSVLFDWAKVRGSVNDTLRKIIKIQEPQICEIKLLELVDGMGHDAELSFITKQLKNVEGFTDREIDLAMEICLKNALIKRRSRAGQLATYYIITQRGENYLKQGVNNKQVTEKQILDSLQLLLVAREEREKTMREALDREFKAYLETIQLLVANSNNLEIKILDHEMPAIKEIEVIMEALNIKQENFPLDKIKSSLAMLSVRDRWQMFKFLDQKVSQNSSQKITEIFVIKPKQIYEMYSYLENQFKTYHPGLVTLWKFYLNQQKPCTNSLQN